MWDELQAHEDSGCFCDALRRHLATQLALRNFRQLALVSGLRYLGPENPWEKTDLTAVVRPYAKATENLLQAAARGNTCVVAELLEEPHDPDGRDGLLTPLHRSSKAI